MKPAWGFVGGSLLILVGLYFVLHGYEARVLASEGLPAQAVVTSLTTGSGSRGSGSSHYVNYRYKTKSGVVINGTVSVSERAWNTLRVGTPLQVRFDPRSPDRHVSIPYGVDDANRWTNVLVPLLLGAFLMYWAWDEYRKPLRRP